MCVWHLNMCVVQKFIIKQLVNWSNLKCQIIFAWQWDDNFEENDKECYSVNTHLLVTNKNFQLLWIQNRSINWKFPDSWKLELSISHNLVTVPWTSSYRASPVFTNKTNCSKSWFTQNMIVMDTWACTYSSYNNLPHFHGTRLNQMAWLPEVCQGRYPIGHSRYHTAKRFFY